VTADVDGAEIELAVVADELEAEIIRALLESHGGSRSIDANLLSA